MVDYVNGKDHDAKIIGNGAIEHFIDMILYIAVPALAAKEVEYVQYLVLKWPLGTLR